MFLPGSLSVGGKYNTANRQLLTRQPRAQIKMRWQSLPSPLMQLPPTSGTMAPTIFWRVQDEDSHGQYSPKSGFPAADDGQMDFKNHEDVHDALSLHLDWGNRYNTPFISVYCDEETAFQQAYSRAARGKQNVIVWTIDTKQSRQRVEYRNVLKLADRRHVQIPGKAEHNAKFEWVFLHQIPPECVV